MGTVDKRLQPCQSVYVTRAAKSARSSRDDAGGGEGGYVERAGMVDMEYY